MIIRVKSCKLLNESQQFRWWFITLECVLLYLCTSVEDELELGSLEAWFIVKLGS